MVLVIGEVLFDIFPEYRRLGGAPFNFAYHLKKLGIDTRFISRIGNDDPGREIMDFIRRHGFNDSDIQIDNVHQTGKVQVSLNPGGIPEFQIQQNAAYDFIQFDPSLKALLDQSPLLIYFGTLVQRTANGFQAIQQMLSYKKTATRTLYDINLRPGCYNDKVIAASLNRADILKLNHEELSILRRFLDEENGQQAIVDRLLGDYGLEAVILTAGASGSQWYSTTHHHRVKPTQTVPVVDTVGAGDAHAAIIALGYLKNWPAQKTLEVAGNFAAYICTVEGALPPDDEVYDRIIAKGDGSN